MSLRAALYARISDAQEGIDAIADQTRRLEDLAAREGYEVVARYSDNDISAWASSGKERPGFQGLRHGIQSRTFDVILAVAEDRLARSNQEKVGLQVACARSNIRWHTLAGGLVDPATAGGALMSTITGAIAQYESDVKSERVKASVVRRRLAGRDIGGPRPFGFTADRRSLIEAEAALVREGAARLLRGDSLYSIIKFFDASGVPTVRGGHWDYNVVRKILARPRNAALALGEDGAVYELTEHPAILTRADYDALALVLTGGEKMGRKPTHLASGGVVHCRCGSHMRYSSQRGGFYRCNASNSGLNHASPGPHSSIKAEYLDSVLPGLAFESLMKRVREGEIATTDEAAPYIADRAALIEQRTVAQDIALMPGADIAHVRRQLAQIAAKLEEVDGRIIRARAAHSASVQEVAAALVAAVEASDVRDVAELFRNVSLARVAFDKAWSRLTLIEQRDLIRATLDVRVNPDSIAEKLAMGDGEIVTVREGPQRLEIHFL